MKFDVVIGNPPYQEYTGGGGKLKSAVQVYQYFMLNTLDYCNHQIMVVPSKWLAGPGASSVSCRSALLNRHMTEIVDYINSTDLFEAVRLYSGICYYHYDENYLGETKVTHYGSAGKEEFMVDLDATDHDIFIRSLIGRSVVDKVLNGLDSPLSLDLTSGKQLGISTYERGSDTPDGYSCTVKLVSSGGIGYIENPCQTQEVSAQAANIINSYKVICGKKFTDSSGSGKRPHELRVLASLQILEPGTAFTDTYIELITAKDRNEAEAYLTYFQSKFIRFLMYITQSTMTLGSQNLRFVNRPERGRYYSDIALYKEYKLSQNEIDYIEGLIANLDDT